MQKFFSKVTANQVHTLQPCMQQSMKKEGVCFLIGKRKCMMAAVVFLAMQKINCAANGRLKRKDERLLITTIKNVNKNCMIFFSLEKNLFNIVSGN
ncbi:hypothetical protein HRG84_16390 [Flavisolibacter sp. BT320]|nr:hypothetical protein [Flavisolibacter longurius]